MEMPLGISFDGKNRQPIEVIHSVWEPLYKYKDKIQSAIKEKRTNVSFLGTLSLL